MSGAHKRYREDGDDYYNNYHQPQPQEYHQETRVRYIDLPPDVKLQKRRQERQEKKEMERTLSYFKSVQRALDEHASGAGDASTLASLVDGFFVELMKLLKADSTLHLLRNGTVCRVIESALTNSLLLHTKSLMYVLLGHVFSTVTSPTASYTMETLVASLAQALSALAEDDVDSFAAEMMDGGPGTHAGSGVPSAATLVTGFVEELTERAEEVILHEVGSRAVRSIVLVLGGFTIRGAPPLSYAVKFTQPLCKLTLALMQTMERTFRDEHTRSDTDVWLNIANTPTASFIIQSLLRVCEPDSEIDVAVRQHLESIQDNKGKTLLRHLLKDPLGCHIFQAYIKVPAPLEVLEVCDVLANRKAATSISTNNRRLKEILHNGEDDTTARSVESNSNNNHNHNHNKGEEDEHGEEANRDQENKNVVRICWDNAFDVVMESIGKVLDPTADHMTPMLYVLQDIVLFAPTAMHLERVWDRLLKPRLQTFLSSLTLLQVLSVFARKCAFAGSSISRDGGAGDNLYKDTSMAGSLEGGSSSGDTLPKDIDQTLRNDVAQGVRYFTVSPCFQKTVITAVCFATRQECTKGAAQFLLVDASVREKGIELARYFLHFHPSASTMFIHAMDRLALRDVEDLLRHTKGSLVLQQYLRAAAVAQSSSVYTQGKKGKEEHKTDKTVAMRFLRRITSLLPDLVGDVYAAYVVEVLYEVGSLEVKETLVKLLVPVYTSLRQGSAYSSESIIPVSEEGEEQQEGAEGEVNTSTPSRPQLREFITRKIMTKCCVELYIHRPDDWAKLAHRQCQVQRLLQRMSIISS